MMYDVDVPVSEMPIETDAPSGAVTFMTKPPTDKVTGVDGALFELTLIVTALDDTDSTDSDSTAGDELTVIDEGEVFFHVAPPPGKDKVTVEPVS